MMYSARQFMSECEARTLRRKEFAESSGCGKLRTQHGATPRKNDWWER